MTAPARAPLRHPHPQPQPRPGQPNPQQPRPQQSGPQRPPLRLVRARPVLAPRTPFVVVLLTVGGLGLLTLLLLNTVVAQDAFRLYELQATGVELSEREQQLQNEVDTLESPALLAQRARRLGMVASGDPLFLQLPDGRVLGAGPSTEKDAPLKIDPEVVYRTDAQQRQQEQAR